MHNTVLTKLNEVIDLSTFLRRGVYGTRVGNFLTLSLRFASCKAEGSDQNRQQHCSFFTTTDIGTNQTIKTSFIAINQIRLKINIGNTLWSRQKNPLKILINIQPHKELVLIKQGCLKDYKKI